MMKTERMLLPIGIPLVFILAIVRFFDPTPLGHEWLLIVEIFIVTTAIYVARTYLAEEKLTQLREENK